MTYAKKECVICHIRLPAPEMKKIVESVNSGHSVGTSIGSKNPKLNVRNYYRKRTNWYCQECWESRVTFSGIIWKIVTFPFNFVYFIALSPFKLISLTFSALRSFGQAEKIKKPQYLANRINEKNDDLNYVKNTEKANLVKAERPYSVYKRQRSSGISRTESQSNVARKKKRTHSKEFKTRVAEAAINRSGTLREVAEQFDISPAQVSNWVKKYTNGELV